MLKSFSEWLLLETMTVSQFLKQPSNKEYVNLTKNIVIEFVKERFNGNQNLMSRYVNWFIKELIDQGSPVDHARPSLANMWQNIGDYIVANVGNNQIQSKFNLVDFTYDQVIDLSDEWHTLLKNKRYRKGSEDGRVVVDLNDVSGFQGWKWVALDRGSCNKEGDAAGHCGNAAGHPGDNILSLRDLDNFVHLTFINNKGILGEMKGRGNSRPSKKYHPAIIKLLLSNEIASLKGGGYAEENNFSFTDLTEDEQKYIKERKPWIDNPTEFEQKRDKIIDGLRKKHKSVSLQKSSVENVGKAVEDLVNNNYQMPKLWDMKQEDIPEIVNEKQIWKFYSELLNETYIRGKKLRPKELFSWMDKAIESLVKVSMEKDRNILNRLKESGGLSYFEHLSNVIKLDDMAHNLNEKQPEILRNAPKRSDYATFQKYVQALTQFLDQQGYELPSYRADNNMISYEFNIKVLEELEKYSKEIDSMTEEVRKGLSPFEISYLNRMANFRKQGIFKDKSLPGQGKRFKHRDDYLGDY